MLQSDMVTLRLFRQDAPFRQLEARSFEGGELTIGRDPNAGWSIDDPDLTVSRMHCSVALKDGILTLTDVSANGVLIGQHRRRPPAGRPMAIAAGESFRFGKFMILVDAAGPESPAPPAEPPVRAPQSLEATTLAFDAPFNSPMLKNMEVGPKDLAVPRDWAASPASAAAAPAPRSETAANLLDAFCAGAGLDASAFAGEDPATLMRRLGEVYRQMVLGLSDQMDARTSLKADYRMDRTTVGAADNNPFKWAPAQRVAVDLLRPRDDGFLSGQSAVESSFGDMKKHLLCMLAGLRAALATTLDAVDPAKIGARLDGRSFVLKNRDAAAWAEYANVYRHLSAEAADNRDSEINRAFRAAYDQRLRELDAMDGRS